MVRKHYMTLCMRDTEVTYVVKPEGVHVTFEKAVPKGFHELVLTLDGEEQHCCGFNEADVGYYKRFLAQNRTVIAQEVAENC